MRQQLTAIYVRDGDGWVATAVEVQGAFVQGKTLDETRSSLLEAVRELLMVQGEPAERRFIARPEVVRESLSIEIGSSPRDR